MDCFVITCEHGGNRIPPAYRRYFSSFKSLLQTHRGWDPGALEMARQLAKAFGAPCVSSEVSRLVVDLNRSNGHPRQFFDAVPVDPPSLRAEVVAKHWAPYRSEVESLVSEVVKRKHRVIHIASHSFTPVLDGQVRTADVGLLYDPSRPGEAALCDRWKAALRSMDPALRVRRNYPYLGKHDGLTAHLRKRFSPRSYIGIELEINHDTVFGPVPRWKALRRTIIDSLRASTEPQNSVIRKYSQ
ncbi:MAG: N-formylglutamate amidohydrolase [Fibrobacteres bacterium]|nr:N-formylglutamate amidohydrolase [Fibrobacterota bacterium]